jgi:hypothetical protein
MFAKICHAARSDVTQSCKGCNVCPYKGNGTRLVYITHATLCYRGSELGNDTVKME